LLLNRKYAENLKDEPTFLAIADERDRESIFNEYISDLRRKEKVSYYRNFFIIVIFLLLILFLFSFFFFIYLNL